MGLIEERANALAELYRENSGSEEGKDFILGDLIQDELFREELCFEDRIVVISQSLELIRKQKPRTKKERLEAIWERKNWFSCRTINQETGETEISWKKDELESYRSKFTYPILLLVILSGGLCIAYEISKFTLKAVANFEGFKKMIDTEISYSEYVTLCINAWTVVTMIDILFMAMFIFMIRSNFFDIEREYLTLKYMVEN